MEVVQQKKGHPKGLYLLFFTEMWERFSYYGMRGILTLFLTKTLVEGGLGIPENSTMLIYGLFTGFVYFTPLIGGWLADTYIGQRKAIMIGALTMMLGQFALFGIKEFSFLQSSAPINWTIFNYTILEADAPIGLWLGLLLLIIGNGFFKPNISTLVSGLYEEGDKRRDSAFSIFYMGINLGAFFAPLVIGLLTKDIFAVKEGGKVISYGYQYGFLASAIGMFIGQIAFSFFASKYLGNLGLTPIAKKTENTEKEDNKKPLTKVEKQRIAVIFIFFIFAIFFWAGFEQAGSSLTLYTDKYIDRIVFGYEIPTEWFQSVNPLFIVLLAPLFAMFWGSKLGQKLTSPLKMGLGMIILGIGFWFMIGAVAERGGDDITDTNIKAGLWWLVMTYLIHTIGELCLSPVGLSVVTKLSPPKLASLLMGVWLLSSFVANIVGGVVASKVEAMGAGSIFTYISIFVIICGILLIALNKVLLKLMHGVK